MQALPRRLQFKTVGFPHSDISGSKATNRLPEAFRRLVASFIAVLGQGIHRVLLCLSYGDLHSTPSHFCSVAGTLPPHAEVGQAVCRGGLYRNRARCLSKKTPPPAGGGTVCVTNAWPQRPSLRW